MQLDTAPLSSVESVESDNSDHAAPEAPGWVLGDRYRVCERIGTGGMAEVFRATDLLLGRDVAVKVFRSVGPTDDAGGAERREIELQALARLSHPHLITLFDASVTDQPPYLVMELVSGPNLAARIAQGPLPEPEVRAIGSQIADALSYVHAHGMVHRDVKPANILLGDDGYSSDGAGRARLSDFGIVRLLGSERMTAAEFTLGTASYLAPEQARGGDVTPAADVYSLGLVLVEALTAKRSFDGPPVEAVLARLSRDPEIPQDLPAPWPALLTAMTARDPKARPTPADVSRRLRSGVSTTPPPVPVPAPVPAPLGWDEPTVTIAAAPIAHPSGPWPVAAVDVEEERRRPGWWLALAALFVLLIVGAACFLAFGATPKGGGSQTPAGAVPTTQHRVPHPRASSAVANVPQPVASHPSASAAPRHSAAPVAKHRSGAPATSAAPTTSTPPSTSVAPSTSAAPTTPPASTAAAIAPVDQPTGG